MARKARYCPGGYVYHVLNRAVGRISLFHGDQDYAAFERVMLEAYQRVPLRIISWCLMKNHWHFVVWPRSDDEVTAYFRALAHTHSLRWRLAHGSARGGPLYQGRFKAFPVQSGEPLRTVCRHVERNALSAGLVKRSQQWRWGSLWLRHQTTDDEHSRAMRKMLSAGPQGRRPALEPWTAAVNAVPTKKELSQLKASENRNRPFGDEQWLRQTALSLNLEHTIRPEGRPRKIQI